jgi:hypothetical protein
MITKEKLNTYPPLFSEKPVVKKQQAFCSYAMEWLAIFRKA